MAEKLTEAPNSGSRTFLEFPFVDDLDADVAILGIPFGTPYQAATMANDQSRAPDAIRRAPTTEDIEYTRNHFDFDLDGHLLAGKNIKVVDCGNVIANSADHKEHYRQAEQAPRKIFSGGLDWMQTRKLVHGLVKKGRVLGMDLVEIAPQNDVGNITMIHAERLICNFIGASIRAGHCG